LQNRDTIDRLALKVSTFRKIYENIYFRCNLCCLCINQRFCSKRRADAIGAPAQRFKSGAHPTPRARVIITNLPEPKPDTDFDTATGSDADSKSGAADCAPVSSTADSDAATAADFLQTADIRANQKQNRRSEKTNAGASDTDGVDRQFLVTDVIRIAYYDYKTAEIDYVVMLKTAFLDKKNSEFSTTTSSGSLVTVKNIRANGVNTPVMIIDAENKAHLPLLVQYPVERNGAYYETAYYISTHPGIVTPEVVNAGKIYIRNILDTARANLQKKGVFISPQVTDIAERLAVVEHVDHQRFRREYHPNIFNDVFALFALNEGQTYRYSVSSAGAGGMVQMIPWTYNMIRSRHFNVGLIPDFVEGMRNHQNAAQAMLLYMQMTWNELISNETIYNALAEKIATPAELMSAGYNSNPAKLSGLYQTRRRELAQFDSRETQIYLQIYASMD
jgi:hypothetical protein